MRTLIFALVTSLVAVAAHAKAPTLDTPTSADRKAFQACLAKGDLPACLGVLFTPCTQSLGEETTAGAVTCFVREEALWREQVGVHVTAMKADRSPTQGQALAKAQAVWEEWRFAKCREEASDYEGGSLARVVMAQCLRDESAARAIALAKRRAGPSE